MRTYLGRSWALTAALATVGCALGVLSVAPAAVAIEGRDLGATITGPATAPLGAAVTYTVEVTNKGTVDATGALAVLFVDGRSRLDSVSTDIGSCAALKGKIKGFRCSFGDLAVGSKATVTMNATLPRKAGPVMAGADAASDDLDANGADNQPRMTTTVG